MHLRSMIKIKMIVLK